MFEIGGVYQPPGVLALSKIKCSSNSRIKIIIFLQICQVKHNNRKSLRFLKRSFFHFASIFSLTPGNTERLPQFKPTQQYFENYETNFLCTFNSLTCLNILFKKVYNILSTVLCPVVFCARCFRISPSQSAVFRISNFVLRGRGQNENGENVL